MIIDARKIEDGSMLHTTVCIIGAGVAGITLALEFKKYDIDVCLLESGGFAADKNSRDLVNGENEGHPYTFGDGSRSRFLGGSSNCWGGWCSPFTEGDMEKRDWVAHSGWPISLTELKPYYQRCHPILKLGPYNYDPVFWEKSINRPNVSRVPFVSGNVTDSISQFSPHVKMGVLYGDELKSSLKIRTFLYANVTDIIADESGETITMVQVKTFSGNSFHLKAKLFVLATGGIENARLLLTSNAVQPNGIGNENDLVGRFFMDHPRAFAGCLKLDRQWKNNRLYNIRYHYHDRTVSAHNQNVACQFVLAPELLRKEALLRSRISLHSYLHSEGSKGVLAATRFKDRIFKRRSEGFSFRKDLVSIVTRPWEVGIYGLGTKLITGPLVKDVKFQIIMEQAPNPSSRITLSNEKDHLGIRRVKVNWQLGELEQRTFNRTLQIVADELQKAGVIKHYSLNMIENNDWPKELTGTWHHMGTTRMHDSPKSGVVDRNCRVHNTKNLFIAGSSVFPTAGSNFPTFTLTALAIRLAEFIKNELTKITQIKG
jgi:choline dehydrogenase-like flavoprotein